MLKRPEEPLRKPRLSQRAQGPSSAALGFRAPVLQLGVFRIRASGFRISGLGFRVQGLG